MSGSKLGNAARATFLAGTILVAGAQDAGATTPCNSDKCEGENDPTVTQPIDNSSKADAAALAAAAALAISNGTVNGGPQTTTVTPTQTTTLNPTTASSAKSGDVNSSILIQGDDITNLAAFNPSGAPDIIGNAESCQAKESWSWAMQAFMLGGAEVSKGTTEVEGKALGRAKEGGEKKHVKDYYRLWKKNALAEDQIDAIKVELRQKSTLGEEKVTLLNETIGAIEGELADRGATMNKLTKDLSGPDLDVVHCIMEEMAKEDKAFAHYDLNRDDMQAFIMARLFIAYNLRESSSSLQKATGFDALAKEAGAVPSVEKAVDAYFELKEKNKAISQESLLLEMYKNSPAND